MENLSFNKEIKKTKKSTIDRVAQPLFLTQKHRSAVFGLAISCPYLKVHPECPLKSVRKMASRDLYEWLDRQTNQDLELIVKKHHTCYALRKG